METTARPGLDDGDRRRAAEILWAAFEGKLVRLLGPQERGVALLAQSLDPLGIVGVRGTDGRLIAVMALKTTAVRHGQEVEVSGIGGDLADYLGVYGAGGLWRAGLMGAFTTRRPAHAMLIDSLATTPSARGSGAGSSLLRYALAAAVRMGVDSVQLDVVEGNAGAIALYRRHGFEIASTTRVPRPLAGWFGVTAAHRMVRDVSRVRAR